MSGNSRTKNTIYNFTSSIGGQLITVLMQFVVRTVFIHTLGKEYLGISGLFSNILSMLSLAEMGVGSAIVFKLYEPIAGKDEKRIAVLIRFYKVIYRCIGLAVAIIGLCLIPFLPSLIKDYDNLRTLNINAVFIYVLYLFNSVSSYLFFAYKSAIIKADQKEYYINLIGYIVTVVSSILQIISMVLFCSFEVFVFILIAKTIIQNMIVARLADKRYPYINAEDIEKLDVQEVREVFKDCGALFIYKVNNVVVKSTDNIVLSAFLGLESVALYSNYYIFYTTLYNLFVKVFNSVGHSIGNLHTTDNVKQEYKVFETTMLVASIIGGTAFVGIYVVADEFISTWIGVEWVLKQPFAFLMGLEIYTSSVKQALAKYRTAYGLFRQGWKRPLFGMFINLIVSVALVKPFGISGVLLGTIISDWLTCMWYDPLIIHRIGFKDKYSVRVYYQKYLLYFFLTLGIGVSDHFICTSFIVDRGWISVIIHAIICGLTTLITMLLATYRFQETKYLLDIGIREIRQLSKRVNKAFSKK